MKAPGKFLRRNLPRAFEGSWFRSHALAVSFICAATSFTLASELPTFDDLLTCSSRFKARADWFAGTGRNEVAQKRFSGYADILLAEARARGGPVDCQMLVIVKSGECDMKETRDARVLGLLSSYVEEGYVSVGLPTCMEDSACAKCMDVLKAATE